MSPEVRRITLDERRPQTGRSRPAPPWIGRAAWLVAPAFLLAIAVGFALLRSQPRAFFGVVLGVVVALPVLWGLVSVFFPAFADRRCPECGELAVEALSEDDLHGLRCAACGYVDRDASAWKFAEERDRPLEPYVLESRGRAAEPETTT